MVRFGVNFACIDAAPEFQNAIAFAKRHPGTVYRVHVGDTGAVAKGVDRPATWDDDDLSVSVERTLVLDATLAMFRDGSVVLPFDLPQDEENDYPREMGGLIRTVQEETKEGKRLHRRVLYVAAAASQPFDYLMAEAYDVLATEGWYRAQGLEMVALSGTPAGPASAEPALPESWVRDDESGAAVFRTGDADDHGFKGMV